MRFGQSVGVFVTHPTSIIGGEIREEADEFFVSKPAEIFEK